MEPSKPDDDWFELERLHRAAEEGDLAEATRLLGAGCALDLFNDISFTPLHCAVRGEHYKVAELLLARGANVDAQDDERAGDTALAVAAQGGYPEIVELLLKHGADPDVPGWMGLTPRLRAQKRKDADGKTILELIERYRLVSPLGRTER